MMASVRMSMTRVRTIPRQISDVVIGLAVDMTGDMAFER